ncbi:DHH family phosphoesterase [Clostridium cellulovorans]|uniref:Phosphoesterase RecJ domain protein n=1 Tax=Clostridium cellulovorans (strain ATCC 35296 / DSM 3052 / OCM 3 / 743B) TaxID=573061 RepID=D9SKN8_CLOC7|nr:DHH family phosphoesterase [Clostridium cellulovorans]ADL51534.1 phosphoesterase RecJ domain protein [Clostridium cellulovorans 743B]
MVMNQILKKIKESKKIAVSFHTSPDGDSIGSSLGLLLGLRTLDKEVYILSKEQAPDNLKFLPNAEEVGFNPTILEGTDILIVLDCGNVARINSDTSIENNDIIKINIDHHASNGLYGDFNYVDTNASAVSEIIYQMLQLLSVKITKEMATCLYVSLLTDTSSFRHSNTTALTHTIAGDLINVGINFSQIHSLVFDNKSLSETKVLARVLENMYLVCDDKIVVLKVTKELLSALGAEEKDASDLISYGLKLKGVEVALLLKESDKGIKISLRAKNDVDVRHVAEAFGGGGHKKAAGALMEGTIERCEKQIIALLEKELR